MDRRLATLKTLRQLREDPTLKEAAILQEQELAKTDGAVHAFVDAFHFDADRDASLARFLAAPAARDILDTIERYFGGRRDVAICEIGAGNGFLAASLVRAGYQDVDILEPAAEHVTGTGYLRSLREFDGITIYNDIAAWYEAPKQYDLVLTNACIHHFHNRGVVAAQVRLKVKDRALWLAFAEFMAMDYEDVLSQLNNHRHAMLYGLYEWPYSASVYIGMLELAGFRLRDIAPIAAHGKRALPPLRAIYRGTWRLLCEAGLSRPAYLLSTKLLRLVARGRLRQADPALMTFEARPIHWSQVQTGFSRKSL